MAGQFSARGGRALMARGRLPAGTMNRTEEAYRALLESQRASGYIVAYWFNPIALRLAKGCYYHPDFMVLRPGGLIELHEVKGSPAIFQDDAKVKCKTAAEMYPFPLFVCYPRRKKDGGGFDVIPYP